MNLNAPIEGRLSFLTPSSITAMMLSHETDEPLRTSAITAAPIVARAKSSFDARFSSSSRLVSFGTLVIENVSLKMGFKGMSGGDRRGNAGHRCEAYQASVSAAKRNRRLHLVARIARAVTRFEDSLFGAAFGVALLFGLLIAVLSVGGWGWWSLCS